MRLTLLGKALALAVLGVAGCSVSLLGDVSEAVHYSLAPLEMPRDETHSNVLPVQLLVRDVTGLPHLDTRKIIFREGEFSFSSYRTASWIEPPTRQLSLMLVRAFRDAGAVKGVSRLAEGVAGDYKLNVELTEFYHDPINSEVVAGVSVQLVNLISRDAVAQRDFREKVGVEKNDAIAAVKGLSEASHKIIKEIIAWAVESLAAQEELRPKS